MYTINIQNKYPIYLEHNTLPVTELDAMVRDIAERVVSAIGRENVTMMELITFFLELDEYIEEKNYNPFYTDQIVTQLTDHFDSEFNQQYTQEEMDAIMYQLGQHPSAIQELSHRTLH